MDNILMSKDSIDAILSSDGSVSGGLDSSSSISGQVSPSGEVPGSLSQNQNLDGGLVKGVSVELNLNPRETIKASLTLPESRSGGTNDYEELINKPKINSITLIKNKSFEELGLQGLTNLELEALLT